MSLRVLLVEPDEKNRNELAEFMKNEGHQVFSIPRLEYVQETELPYAPDMALMTITSTSNIPVLASFRKRHPATQIALMTDRNLQEPENYALKTGARVFLQKPVSLDDLHKLLAITTTTVRNAEAWKELRLDGLREYTFEEIIGESRNLQDAIHSAEEASQSEGTSVLIVGEPGTGKELLARAIHSHSSRADKPFVTVNCATIPERLMETELFGYSNSKCESEEHNKAGLFEVADGGTVLMDDIGEMNTMLQAEINQVLENGLSRRVGGKKEIQVDVRAIATTRRDPEANIAQGAFRQDFYATLSRVKLNLPPLRERGHDIELLLHHFIDIFSSRLGRPRPLITPAAVEAIRAYHWPGNVTELKNVIKTAVSLATNQVIHADDLSISAVSERTNVDLSAKDGIEFPDGGLALESVEKEVIQAALRKTNNNVSRAARLLKVGRGSLRYKIKKHGIAA
jgi:DNA-binding NtrC family response regulator